jgi:DNA polymerase V
MESELFFGPAYKGTKQYEQHDVPTANATGFGSAADDYMERGIDLNEQLISNKAATFFMRMNSEAMIGAGIFNGDVLIIDRSITAVNGKIIVAVLNDEMLVRRLEKTFNKVRLLADNKRLAAIEVDVTNMQFSVWGVVTYAIHAV